MRHIDNKQLADLKAEIETRLNALPQLSTAPVRLVRREFSKRVAKSPPESVVELAMLLIKRPEIANRFFAYELVHHHRQALRSLNAGSLTKLGHGIDSWGAVDMFGSYLAGPAWRAGQVPDRLVLRWARSKDRWWRRAALVSTVPLNTKARGGSGDAARTVKVCETLIADRDEMVVKAMSWALRELAKREAKPVRDFLAKHKEVLAPRVIREVNNKLITGLKIARK